MIPGFIPENADEQARWLALYSQATRRAPVMGHSKLAAMDPRLMAMLTGGAVGGLANMAIDRTRDEDDRDPVAAGLSGLSAGGALGLGAGLMAMPPDLQWVKDQIAKLTPSTPNVPPGATQGAVGGGPAAVAAPPPGASQPTAPPPTPPSGPAAPGAVMGGTGLAAQPPAPPAQPEPELTVDDLQGIQKDMLEDRTRPTPGVVDALKKSLGGKGTSLPNPFSIENRQAAGAYAGAALGDPQTAASMAGGGLIGMAGGHMLGRKFVDPWEIRRGAKKLTESDINLGGKDSKLPETRNPLVGAMANYVAGGSHGGYEPRATGVNSPAGAKVPAAADPENRSAYGRAMKLNDQFGRSKMLYDKKFTAPAGATSVPVTDPRLSDPTVQSLFNASAMGAPAPMTGRVALRGDQHGPSAKGVQNALGQLRNAGKSFSTKVLGRGGLMAGGGLLGVGAGLLPTLGQVSSKAQETIQGLNNQTPNVQLIRK